METSESQLPQKLTPLPEDYSVAYQEIAELVHQEIAEQEAAREQAAFEYIDQLTLEALVAYRISQNKSFPLEELAIKFNIDLNDL